MTRLPLCLLLLGAAVLLADFGDSLPPPLDHPAIHYRLPANDAVAKLDARLRDGSVQLGWREPGGYLRALLDALQIPVESQILVMSKTSLQAGLISPANPRSIFFNDHVAVAWMHGGFIELAAQDPVQGVIFYMLPQDRDRPLRFTRDDAACLRCHRNDATFGAPGVFARSTVTAAGGEPLLIYGGGFSDHRTPLEARWGGWYVTGTPAGLRHMGNVLVTDREHPSVVNSEPVATLAGRFPVDRYLSPYSDAAALLVFDHQMYMMNLITRYGWEARAGAGDAQLAAGARELVDYLLFRQEAPLSAKIASPSGFAAKFSAQGPHDSRGRSLRQLNLTTRLLEFPCSYMIYSEAFDALPATAKAAVYRRMWQVLSAEAVPNKQAIVEILRETKPEVRPYFR
jgi:hypothetical protein